MLFRTWASCQRHVTCVGPSRCLAFLRCLNVARVTLTLATIFVFCPLHRCISRHISLLGYWFLKISFLFHFLLTSSISFTFQSLSRSIFHNLWGRILCEFVIYSLFHVPLTFPPAIRFCIFTLTLIIRSNVTDGSSSELSELPNAIAFPNVRI